MKIETRDGRRERKSLLWLITSTELLSRFANHWGEDGLFSSRWANQIGKWCVGHFAKYSKAPGGEITSYFERWAEKAKDKDTVQLVNDFLAALSEEHSQEEERPLQYMVDYANEYFNEVRLERMESQLRQLRQDGKIKDALSLISSFERLELASDDTIDALRDEGALKALFDEEEDPLIEYPGDAGRFLNASLVRDGFISFLAPEKRGKSFWLIDMAWRALEERRRVAFFQAGDMSRNQTMRRFACRAARRPFWPGTVKLPTEWVVDGKKVTGVLREDKKYEDRLSFGESRLAFEEFIRSRIRSKKTYLKLTCVPASTISVRDMEAKLDNWEKRDGWSPDCVFIDYAELLAPIDYKKDERGQTNDTWKALRALSQKRHCLVVTATQAKATSYKANLIEMEHFSEDKRKLAHATGVIGINRDETEKEEGRYRLNWVVLRERDFSPKKVVHLAGCLGVVNPCVLSTF